MNKRFLSEVRIVRTWGLVIVVLLGVQEICALPEDWFDEDQYNEAEAEELKGAFELLQEAAMSGDPKSVKEFALVMHECEQLLGNKLDFGVPDEDDLDAPEKVAAPATDTHVSEEDYLFKQTICKSSHNQAEYKDQARVATILQRIKNRWQGDIPDQIIDLVNYSLNQKACIASGKHELINRVLLYGKPGMGKSLLAEVLAGELEVPLFAFSSSLFADKYIGEAQRKVRRAFAEAKALNAPTILFLDEIDAIGTQRTGRTHEEHRTTLLALLKELDAIKGDPNVFVIAATNVDPYKELGVDETVTWSATPVGLGRSKSWMTPGAPALDKAVASRFAAAICEIKVLTREQKSQAFLQFFKDKELDPLLANKALADALVYQMPDNISPRYIEALVAKAKSKYFFGNLGGHKKCLCTCFNEVLLSTKETNWDGYWLGYIPVWWSGPVSIACVHGNK